MAKKPLPMVDVVTQYRVHADKIANKERARATRSVLIEFYDDGVTEPETYIFGVEPEHRAEAIQMLCDVSILAIEAVQDANAAGGN